jgi:hypothetical protein
MIKRKEANMHEILTRASCRLVTYTSETVTAKFIQTQQDSFCLFFVDADAGYFMNLLTRKPDS